MPGLHRHRVPARNQLAHGAVGDSASAGRERGAARCCATRRGAQHVLGMGGGTAITFHGVEGARLCPPVCGARARATALCGAPRRGHQLAAVLEAGAGRSHRSDGHQASGHGTRGRAAVLALPPGDAGVCIVAALRRREARRVVTLDVCSAATAPASWLNRPRCHRGRCASHAAHTTPHLPPPVQRHCRRAGARPPAPSAGLQRRLQLRDGA